MKSAQSIEIIMRELKEFFSAADHLKLDESVIESQFRKLLIENHCIDHDDPSKPLDNIGIIKSELFDYEMLHREFID